MDLQCYSLYSGAINNMIYDRNVLNFIIQSTEEYPITLVTGARQTGKTTLVSFFEKNRGYTYISFDDSKLLEKAVNNPQEFLEEYKPPLIIDEIQKAGFLFEAIEKKVNDVRRLEGSIKANGMYILTGSQKLKLMKGVSESMSGRVGIIELMPLSQSELNFYSSSPFVVDNESLFKKEECSELEHDLYETIVRGFYPARWEFPNKPIRGFYSNYVKTYLERDVSEIINVKDKVKFENFLKLIASYTGQELVVENICKSIKIDNKTVISWLNILVASDIISLVQPYHENSITKRIVKRSKLYFNDTGLVCYLLGIDTVNSLIRSSFKGPVLETYVFDEIKKSYVNANKEINIYFYRDTNQNEIDFVIINDGKLYMVEAKSGSKYTQQDIKGFKQLDNTRYEISGKCILCCTDKSYRIMSGIYAFPLKVI